MRSRNPEDPDFQKKVRKARGFWMYPFSKIKQESGEGWFIDWLSSHEGIPIEEVEIDDPIADWSLNETIYWTVRDIDVDGGRIWLDATDQNPFITGVGAGGAQLGDWDWKALTGEAHQLGVDRALRWSKSGCLVFYDTFTKLLKGVVATEFGPNGAQGGWYNAHDRACVGARKGMTESEIVAWDAKALKKIGLDVPAAALRGEVDAGIWTDFVGGTDEISSKMLPTLLDGENWDDLASVKKFIFEHPMAPIKLRNWAALNELWRPYYRRVLEKLTDPPRWDSDAWVARHERLRDEIEARWKAGEYERPELESVVRGVAKAVADVRNPTCEDVLGIDPYYMLKEKAITLAARENWPDVLMAHERNFDPNNRKHLAWAWSELKDKDALLRMEAAETHPEPLNGILHALEGLGVDPVAVIDASPQRYAEAVSKVGEDSERGYHAKELAQFIENRRRRRRNPRWRRR